MVKFPVDDYKTFYYKTSYDKRRGSCHLKYMISKYALDVFGIQFCLGLQLPPSNIITFSHFNFPSVSTIRELFWGWQTTL